MSGEKTASLHVRVPADDVLDLAARMLQHMDTEVKKVDREKRIIEARRDADLYSWRDHVAVHVSDLGSEGALVEIACWPSSPGDIFNGWLREEYVARFVAALQQALDPAQRG